MVNSNKKQRQYLTAVAIECGVITLIEDSGEIAQYRQRGIQRIDEKLRRMLIGHGFLRRDWQKFKELPSHYSIAFEDEIIMGKARASYPDPYKLIEAVTGKQVNKKVAGKTTKKTANSVNKRIKNEKTNSKKC